jgi:hypothetical protein
VETKKKRGRPALPREEKLSAVMLFRLTEREEARLCALAKEMGVTVSECVRLFMLAGLERKNAA